MNLRLQRRLEFHQTKTLRADQKHLHGGRFGGLRQWVYIRVVFFFWVVRWWIVILFRYPFDMFSEVKHILMKERILDFKEFVGLCGFGTCSIDFVASTGLAILSNRIQPHLVSKIVMCFSLSVILFGCGSHGVHLLDSHEMPTEKIANHTNYYSTFCINHRIS